jgi:hypothetical protein
MHESCITRVGPEELVIEEASGLTIEGPAGRRQLRCAYPRLDTRRPALPQARNPGWVADMTGTAPINAFGFNWFDGMETALGPVPHDPVSRGNQQLYYFSGLTNDSGLIIQPVLQWGTSPAGGGDFWAIAAWSVDAGNNATVSDLLRVNPGQSVFGKMLSNSCSSSGQCRWRITVGDGSKETSTNILSASAFRTAHKAVFEEYRATRCSELASTSPTVGVGYVVSPTMPAPIGTPQVTFPPWTTTISQGAHPACGYDILSGTVNSAIIVMSTTDP